MEELDLLKDTNKSKTVNEHKIASEDVNEIFAKNLHSYEEVVAYIENIPKFTKKNGLEHTKKLLTLLGHPDRRMEIVHVAGSNGKGSVCAMLERQFREAGKKTGLFTSPHLVAIEERMKINGENCSRAQFVHAFHVVMKACEYMMEKGETHPTYFELLFLMSLVLFAEEKVELAVLETGLGGRLDATNAVEEPLACVITSISLEHTEYLGESIEKIAAEKAGILKEGVPVVFDGSLDAVSEVIKARAREVRAPFYEIKKDRLALQKQSARGIDFSYQCRYDEVVQISIPFIARYQMMNAALAFLTAKLLLTGREADEAMLKQAILQCKWPGRMQEAEPDIYFDGAHNPDGIRAFTDTVKEIGGKRPILVFAIVKDKDYKSVIKKLSEISWEVVVLTQVIGSRAKPVAELAELFAKYGQETICITDAKEAYRYGKARKKKGQKLFCGGSLYLIGELEKEIGGMEYD